MKIVYHCFGGSHSSVTAAGLHLGLLPDYRLPQAAEILKLPFFDEQVASDHGIIRYIGQDENSNQVFIVGRRNLGFYYEAMMQGLLEIAGVNTPEILFVDTMPCVNWLMKIGGFSSRRLGLTLWGKPLVIVGIRAAYPRFVSLVQKTKGIGHLDKRADYIANNLV